MFGGLSLFMGLALRAYRSISVPVAPSGDGLTMENGDAITMENADPITTE